MAYDGKTFESPIYNQMWCLKIVPNNKDFFKNEAPIYLQMCACPKNISKMCVRWKINCTELEITTDETADFDINPDGDNCWGVKNILSFKQFKNCKSADITLSVNINILELYDNNGNKTEWNICG
eukprot:528789_1